MTKLVTAEQMRSIEAASAAAGVSTSTLMENAGAAAAREIWRALHENASRPVLVLVGPGNNGGDGLVAARHLRAWGAEVHAYLLRPRSENDEVWRAALAAGVGHTLVTDDASCAHLDTFLAETACVVDALLGTGNNRALTDDLATVLDHVNAARNIRREDARLLLVSLDLPTGVNADTGAADSHTVAADMTVCFGLTKVGLTQSPGRLFAGETLTVDIGLPDGVDAELPYERIDLDVARRVTAPRPADANKGTFGRAVVAGGSRRYPGAIRLAAEACARSGAGLTTIAAPAVVQPLIAPAFPDATHEPLPSAAGAMRGAEAARALLRALPGVDALLVGPGLSLTTATEEFTRNLLCGLDAFEGLRAVVLDADALNVLAKHRGWQAWSAVPRVLTPHPGEMARLMRCSVGEVQADRLGAVLKLAEQTDSVVVLKGAGTIVAAPDGRAAISDAAVPMLATAGTGDVLAGILVGLLAQGADPFEAASTAVYLHAECGRAIEAELGAAGGLAQDLLRALPAVRRTLDER